MKGLVYQWKDFKSYYSPAPKICGFIAQLVRALHRYREVMGPNPLEVLNFFQASYAIA